MYSTDKLIILHEIFKSTKRLNTTYSSYYSLYRVVKESGFKVCSTCFRMRQYIITAPKRMFCENRLNSEFKKFFYAELFFVSAVWFANNTTGKAYYSYLVAFFQWFWTDHQKTPFLYWFRDLILRSISRFASRFAISARLS